MSKLVVKPAQVESVGQPAETAEQQVGVEMAWHPLRVVHDAVDRDSAVGDRRSWPKGKSSVGHPMSGLGSEGEIALNRLHSRF